MQARRSCFSSGLLAPISFVESSLGRIANLLYRTTRSPLAVCHFDLSTFCHVSIRPAEEDAAGGEAGADGDQQDEVALAQHPV